MQAVFDIRQVYMHKEESDWLNAWSLITRCDVLSSAQAKAAERVEKPLIPKRDWFVCKSYLLPDRVCTPACTIQRLCADPAFQHCFNFL